MDRSRSFRLLVGGIGALLVAQVSTAWSHEPPEPEKAAQGAMVGRPGVDKQGRKAADAQSKTSGFQNPGMQKGFNPQPEPPGDKTANAKSKASGFQNPGMQKGFNPQPEPPGDKSLGQLPAAPANAKQ